MSFNFFRTSSSSFWDLEGLLGTGLGLGFGEGGSIFLSETRAKGLCLGGGNPCLKLRLGEGLEGFPFPNLDFTLNQKVLNLFLKTIPKTTNKIKINKRKNFKSYLKSLPPVIYIVEEIGITDVDIELMLPTGESAFQFIDKIRFNFPALIRDYEAFTIKTLKLELLPF